MGVLESCVGSTRAGRTIEKTAQVQPGSILIVKHLFVPARGIWISVYVLVPFIQVTGPALAPQALLFSKRSRDRPSLLKGVLC